MKRHPKAPSSGSSMRTARSVALFVCAFAAFLGSSAPAALADNPPTVTTNAAESVGVTTAKLSGQVNPDGAAGEPSNTTWRFQYSPVGQESWSTAAEGLIDEGQGSEEADPVSVEALVGFGGELQPGAEYEFRLQAENGAGSAETATSYPTFTMDAATAPQLTAEAATDVAYTTATLHGAVDPEGGNENEIASEVLPIRWQLQYSRAGQEAWNVGGEGLIEGAEATGSTPIAVEAPLPSRSLGHGGFEYEARLVAFYGSPSAPLQATSSGSNPTFTTLTVAKPTVTIDPVTTFTTTTARFSGQINPNSTDSVSGVRWFFACIAPGPSCPKLTVTGGDLAPDTTPHPVETEATGLLPNTTYTVFLHGDNQGGEETPTTTFTTAPAPPLVHTVNATGVEAEGAILRGAVNPYNSPTSYWFEWGQGDCASNPCQSIPLAEDGDAGSGGKSTPVAEPLTGLEPGTTYHFRLLAENATGTSAGVDRAFTTPSVSGPCPNEARRAEQPLAFVLGSCRAWELATPGTDKDVMADPFHTRAAAGESPGLPMAVKFSSLGGFAGVEGMGTAADYIAERGGAAGTSGWAVHGITPPQEPKSYDGLLEGMEPSYQLLDADLTRGFFRSISSLPGTSENAKEVPNLYLREDIRDPGAGDYQLRSDSVVPQPPLNQGSEFLPWAAAASADFQHVLFETKLNLTADASGPNPKLYKADGGSLRLVRANDTCAGNLDRSTACSMAGPGGVGTHQRGLFGPFLLPNVISTDGSRVNFSSPFGEFNLGKGIDFPPTGRQGVVTKLYQLDDQGTAATDDDAVIQLSMSEKASPEPAGRAFYQTASTDGNRVFFLSDEQLTDTPGRGLYMWERQSQNESQELGVDATGGTFTLTAHTQPSFGAGQLNEGSTTVDMSGIADPGSFTVGQTITGEGIPAGTTVTEVGSFFEGSQKFIVLSNPATETATRNLSASFGSTTAPLPWNATAAEVEAALEGLDSIGTGNVSVSGGPGGSGDFAIEFTGALSGVNLMPLTAGAGGLSGGASTATVATTNDVRNLSLVGKNASGAMGASEDGHRVYFGVGDEIWLWQDALPGESLLHVATFPDRTLFLQLLSISWAGGGHAAPITPDGRFLVFLTNNGNDLPPAHQDVCEREFRDEIGIRKYPCTEAYVYRADTSTATEPDIVCASCNFSVPGSAGDAAIGTLAGKGTTQQNVTMNRFLSGDGRHFFFNTDAALVPEDTNGVLDAYEYDRSDGEPHLLSSGTDPAPSYFMESNADGSDAFFATRAQLSGWDDDAAYDLYDARVDGGFSEPPAGTAGCNGADSCRAPVSPAPPPPSIGSGSVEGPGDPKYCRKGTRRVKKGDSVRCVNKHKKHKKRHANNDRRAGR